MAPQNYQHPLPAPPGQPQEFSHQQQQNYYNSAPQSVEPQSRARPRSRALSFLSDKSQKSGGSNNLHSTTETHDEKESKRLTSKADPTMAMNEAEPSAVAAYTQKSLGSIRDMQHRDPFGNPISEPDRSNPTRSRWERPLDTIRSFEAAVDGGYNRQSYIRPEMDPVANWNRRSSYYGNGSTRFAHESYYGGRPQSTFRPESSAMDPRQNGIMARDSYYDQQQQQPGYQTPGRQRYPRAGSEPQFTIPRQADVNVYALPVNHRSYETVASGSGSGLSTGDHGGYQTDPTSSDNSSIERRQSPPKRRQEPVDDYGIGFSQAQEYQPSPFSVGYKGSNVAEGPSSQYQYGSPPLPPVPQKEGGLLRKATNTASPQARPDSGEKRKSWLMRRLSKQS